MENIQTKIKDIEAEMARTQKNKATANHLGLLKAKLAKLKRELIESVSKKSGGKEEGFDVAKTGDARIGLVGFPSVGKSTMLTMVRKSVLRQNFEFFEGSEGERSLFLPSSSLMTSFLCLNSVVDRKRVESG